MARKQWNGRLPMLTHRQIKALAAQHGLSESDVIAVAVDRFARESEYLPARDAETAEEAAEIEQADATME